MKKTNFFIFLGILISIFIVFDFLDYTVSKSFKAEHNWFTSGFETYGKSIAVFPVFVCLITQVNYVLLNHTRYSRVRWLWLYGSLFIFIYILFTILWTLGFNYHNFSLFKTVLILIMVPSLSFSYVIFFVNSKIMMSEEMGVYLQRSINKVFWYMLLSFLTLIIFKEFFGRLRPYEVIDLFKDKSKFSHGLIPNFSSFRDSSFPSGHTLASCSLFVLLYMVPKQFKKTKYVLFIIIGLFVLLTGISRILLHAHWATDVVFSLIISLFFFWLSPIIVNSFGKINNIVETKHG